MAVEPGRRLVQEQKRSGVFPGRAGPAEPAEVADELQALGFAAAERVEGLAEREVAEPDGVEAGQPRTDRPAVVEEGEGRRDRSVEQVRDRPAAPGDRENLRPEAPALADGAGNEHVREKLHLDALVPEARGSARSARLRR